jgi:serine/threonine protein kinase
MTTDGNVVHDTNLLPQQDRQDDLSGHMEEAPVSSSADGTKGDKHEQKPLHIPRFAVHFNDKRDEWSGLKGCIIDNKYLLLDLIGFGGTGAAFRTHDMSVGREACLKLFYSVPQTNVETVRRATDRSVRGLVSISHRHLLTILDYGLVNTATGDASLYIASKFIDGESLYSWCASLAGMAERATADSTPLPLYQPPMPMVDVLHRKLRLAKQIADAVRTAHLAIFVDTIGFEEHGVFHGDLTPGNILVDKDDAAVIIDFMMPDIQKLIVNREWVERRYRDERWKFSNQEYSFHPYATEAYGTPGFMSPEQATKGIVTAVSDIYTLGLTFAFLFFSDLLKQEHTHMPFVPAWQRGWRCSRQSASHDWDADVLRRYILVETIVERMTKIQPRDRFQSMEEVVRFLSDV